MPSSSRIRVYTACSLDGYIAGPGDDLSFLAEPAPPNSPVSDPAALQFDVFMGQVGAMLMGRSTFDVVDAMEIEWPYGEMPVLVATHRALKVPGPFVTGVTGDIGDLVRQAKDVAGDKDVYLDGGNLIRQALNAGLVDEMCLTLVPTLLGSGIRLFDGLTGTSKLAFVSHHTFGQGMVQLVTRPRA